LLLLCEMLMFYWNSCSCFSTDVDF